MYRPRSGKGTSRHRNLLGRAGWYSGQRRLYCVQFRSQNSYNYCGYGGVLRRLAIIICLQRRSKDLGDHKFQHDHDVETVVTGWLITHSTD